MHSTNTILLFLLLITVRPGLAQPVSSSQLEQREGLWYAIDADSPFTGAVNDPGELEGNVENGHRIGRWTAWQDNGEIFWVNDYDQGQTTYHAMYFSDGSKRAEVHYTDGRLDGVARQWYQDGTVKSETSYVNGQRHGSYTLRDLEGKLLYEAMYQAGKLDGLATWWYNNGQKRWETNYDNGARSGVWTQWTREGRVLGQSDWSEGKMVSRM